MDELLRLARPQVLSLKPYEAASPRDGLRLNANESAWRCRGDTSSRGLNRYPEPIPRVLAARLAGLYRVEQEQLVVTRGSDEGIDLLMRVFCREGQDAVVICPPTFGMYRTFAELQGAAVVEVPLLAARDFALDAPAVLAACTDPVKLVFLCSPNNPTGQCLDRGQVLELCRRLAGRALVVVDEAYAEFAGRPGFIGEMASLPNLVVLRTLSKAHGLAGARLGALIAHPVVAELVARAMPPYALATPVLELALELLCGPGLEEVAKHVATVRAERTRLAGVLQALPGVLRLWPSDANFLLLQWQDPAAVVRGLDQRGILVRDFSAHPALPGCVRVTVGSEEQNARLLQALEEITHA